MCRDGAEGCLSWYALHVRSNCEPIVEQTLALEGLPGFFPHQEIKRSRGGIWLRPYFPGYVFADADLVCHRRALVSIPQVLRIVGVGDEPAVIPSDEIAAVRTVVDVAELVKAAPAKAYLEGDQVVVKCGPLRGITGTVVYLKNATRILVAVSMLGQAVSAEVDASWLCLSSRPSANFTSAKSRVI